MASLFHLIIDVETTGHLCWSGGPMLIMQTDWRATVTLLNQGPMIIGQGMIKKILETANSTSCNGRRWVHILLYCYKLILTTYNCIL